MKKLKVMSVVGTRPEIIRLSRVLAKLDEYCDHLIIHTGQNYDYELNEVFFKDLGVRKPDYFLNAAGKNAAETIGQVIIKVDDVLEQEKPEAMLVLGDTNSCISAIPAKRRKIPIFHMEAGTVLAKIDDHVKGLFALFHCKYILSVRGWFAVSYRVVFRRLSHRRACLRLAQAQYIYCTMFCPACKARQTVQLRSVRYFTSRRYRASGSMGFDRCSFIPA